LIDEFTTSLRLKEKKMKRTLKYILLFGLALLLMASAAPNVFAADGDADAGDTVSNTATIGYSVGGVTQVTVNSNTATFLIDHKVRPDVTGGSAVNVIPASMGQYLTFTVRNDGNTHPTGTLAMRLTIQAPSAGLIMDSPTLYRETDGTNDYSAGDTLIDASGIIDLARDSAATIYLVANTPSGATNGQTAIYHLIATAWDTGANTPLARDTDGDDPDTVEVVWADDAGTAAGDVANGGFHSDSGTFSVESAALAAVKNSTVVSDPFGGFMRVPGARVQYSIVVTNSGAVPANSVVLTDAIPAGTNFVVGSLSAPSSATLDYQNSDGWGYSPGTTDARYGIDDPTVTEVRITLADPIAAAGGTITLNFDVVIE
jgi:uncharacterized repeat protein (TIGR01451 family)